MKRLAQVFQNPNHKALILYLTVGYPELQDTLEIAPRLAAAGADIIELGIPFSDPLADGATIQASSYIALKNGVTPDFCLETAARIRRISPIPLVFMTYFNPILNFGIEKFCQASFRAGIDGLIVPDLPSEESNDLDRASLENGLDLVYLLSPTSTPERIRLAAAKSRGFVYLVSVAGVTGARQNLPSNLKEFIGRVRQYTRQPLCLGFGISTPQQAGEAAVTADGIIIGSRLVQLMQDDPSFKLVENFTRDVRTAIDSRISS